MKMDQVAFYCGSVEAEDMIKRSFGLLYGSWTYDTVRSESIIEGSAGKSDLIPQIAILQFNYGLGIELEILRYIEGRNWHDNLGLNERTGLPFLSHIGIHLNHDEDFPEMLNWDLVQETWTRSHTNKLIQGRTYHYRIFRSKVGTYVKYIKRIYK
ncbi:MAG: hypothetical protein L0287_18280 [Anaerolineae bacterium]|nr:hypothetical protein [Anaerolineae bacterium]